MVEPVARDLARRLIGVHGQQRHLEGVRRLGTGPGETLYVGDNRLLDAEGSTAAGLRGVWLNRAGEPAPGFTGREVASLLDLLA